MMNVVREEEEKAMHTLLRKEFAWPEMPKLHRGDESPARAPD